MKRRLSSCLLGPIVAVSIFGCIGLEGRGAPPASPTLDFVPTIVGVVERIEPGTPDPVAILESGDRLALPPRARVGVGSQPEPGWLLLAGGVDPPGWWSALPTSAYPLRSPGNDDAAQDASCWQIYGGAFDDGTSIHFTSGLRLAKAQDFRVVEDYIPNPFPARSGDSFCVDRTGDVALLVSIWQER